MVKYGCAPSSWVLRMQKSASQGGLCAYLLQSLACAAVETVIHPTGFKSLEAEHPVIFARLQLASVFGFGVVMMVPDLLDQGKFRVAVEIVPGEPEMVVEGSSFWVFYVASVSVKS